MKRLTIFVKGNVDVRDSLHFCRIAGDVVWNGINEVLRQRELKCSVRIKHETLTRSDALLECRGTIPPAFTGRDLPLGAYSLASQFSDGIFTTDADAIVLSIQPDATMSLVRHRRDNFLFYPNDADTWSADDRGWLRSDYEKSGLLPVDVAINHLAGVVDRIRHHSEAPILVYNLSPVIPGEHVHCYQGLDETFSTRIRKFNLALGELSASSGISIIDVDTIVARHGADALKLDVVHLKPVGYRLLAEEVVRVLEDLGVLDEAAA